MSGFPRSLLVPAFLGACWGAPMLARGQTRQDPPQKFSFEIKVQKEPYMKAIAALDQERIDPQRVAASKFPPYSVFIDSVTPGGQADQAGLKAGWRIFAHNDEERWHHRQGLPMANGRREIHAVSPEGERKIFRFGEGKIGTLTSNSHFPERWVLANIPRGKWDGDILVAMTAWNTGDHELAETALRLAVNRGMPPNPVLTHYASLIALNRGQYELARSLNAEVLKKYPDRKKIPRFFHPGLRTVATSLGDFALLKDVIMELEGFPGDLQPQIVDYWKTWRDTNTCSPLLPLAKENAGPDLLSKCEQVTVKWQSAAHVMDFNPARDGTYIKELDPGRYDRLSFAPPGGIKHMIWTTRFAFRETAPSKTLCTLTFCLVDRQGKSNAARFARFLPLDKSAVSFRIWRSGVQENWAQISAGPSGGEVGSQCDVQMMSNEEYDQFKKLVEANSPKAKKITRHVNELSLIRIGLEAEIILNGKSLLHVPIDPQVEDIFCILQNEGLSAVVDGMTVKEIKFE